MQVGAAAEGWPYMEGKVMIILSFYNKQCLEYLEKIIKFIRRYLFIKNTVGVIHINHK